MKKIIKILILPATVAIIALGSFANVAFAQMPLDVQFEQNPLFSSVNFVPGDSVTRFIRVTNDSGSSQRIATEAINKNDLNNFGEKLNLIIKEGNIVIFDNTLKQFFDQGETYLSSLANNTTTQYDFTISFNSSAGDFYQGKTLGFDIIVGFEGTEGGLSLPSPGGGTGSGSGGRHGLTIQNEAATTTFAENSVTITWLTSYAATSQVIYGLASGGPYTLDLSILPGLGYPLYSTEDLSKVINHSVLLTGLTPGSTYKYRVVSRASPPTISYEREFTVPVYQTSNAITAGPPGASGNKGEILGASSQNNGAVSGSSSAASTSNENNLAAAFAAGWNSLLSWWWLWIPLVILAAYLFWRFVLKSKDEEI